MLRATLTIIPPEIRATLIEKGVYEPNDNLFEYRYDWKSFSSTHLDDVRHIFGEVFAKDDSLLKYAIEGDYSQPPSFAEWKYSERDQYIGYVSAEHCQQISELLSSLTSRERILLFSQAGIKYEKDVQEYFEKFAAHYEEAAQKGAATMILIW